MRPFLRRLTRWMFGPNPSRWGSGHDFRVNDGGTAYECSRCGMTIRQMGLAPAWWMFVSTPLIERPGRLDFVMHERDLTDVRMYVTIFVEVGPCEDVIVEKIMEM